MNRFRDDSSEFDSSEEEDQINPHFFAHKNPLQTHKSAGQIPSLKKDIVYQKHEEEPQQEPLQPKMKYPTRQKEQNQKKSGTILQNCSGISSTTQNSRTNRRPLTAAYTFKLKTPVNGKKKRNDPVSLFQQTSQAWKKDKFLTNRAHNKEGRKLELQKRNKIVSKVIAD